MAKECEICGKKPMSGNNVSHAHNKTRRVFNPNLQKVRVTTANGTHKTLRVCVQCIRSGAVTKTVRNAPFRLPAGESTGKAKSPKAGSKRKKK